MEDSHETHDLVIKILDMFFVYYPQPLNNWVTKKNRMGWPVRVTHLEDRSLGIPLPAKVSCEHIRECSDYYEKCFKCNNNNAKSYFKPREAEA